MGLPRYRAAPGARFGRCPLEGDRALPAQCRGSSVRRVAFALFPGVAGGTSRLVGGIETRRAPGHQRSRCSGMCAGFVASGGGMARSAEGRGRANMARVEALDIRASAGSASLRKCGSRATAPRSVGLSFRAQTGPPRPPRSRTYCPERLRILVFLTFLEPGRKAGFFDSATFSFSWNGFLGGPARFPALYARILMNSGESVQW